MRVFNTLGRRLSAMFAGYAAARQRKLPASAAVAMALYNLTAREQITKKGTTK